MSVEYRRPYVTAHLAQGRRRYEIREGDGGWFRYCDLFDHHEADLLWISRIPQSIYDHDEESWSSVRSESALRMYGNRPLDGILFTNRSAAMKGAFLRPIIKRIAETWYDADGTQPFKLDTYYLHPTSGEWTATGLTDAWDKTDADDGCFIRCHQKYTSVTVGAETYPIASRLHWDQTNGLCPNLWFAAGFSRAAMTEEQIAYWQNELDIGSDRMDAYGTKILWGGTLDTYFRWCLKIPVLGKPVLYQGYAGTAAGSTHQLWLERTWSGGDLSEINPSSAADEGKTYIIGVIGDNLCVSEGDFGDDNFAFYTVADGGQPIVPSGDALIFNYPGQATLWMAPIIFIDSETEQRFLKAKPICLFEDYVQPQVFANIYGFTLKRDLVTNEWTRWTTGAPAWWPEYFQEAPYSPYPDQVPQWVAAEPDWPPYGQPGEWPTTPPAGWPDTEPWPPISGYEANGDPIFRDAADYVVTGTTYFPHIEGGGVSGGHHAIDGWDRYMSWWVEIEQIAWDSGTATGPLVYSYSTPFVEAASLWQWSSITDNGTPAFSEEGLPARLRTDEQLGEDRAGIYELEVENHQLITTPADDVRPGALVRLYGGATLTDDSAVLYDLGDHSVVDIPRGTDGKAEWVLVDPLSMLNLIEWDLGDVDFWDWLVVDAMWFVASSLGYGADDVDFEDLGLRCRGRGRYHYEMGTTAAEILSDLARKGNKNAALWYDTTTGKITTGCPYCRTQRTALNWASHNDDGWNSSGCLAADIVRAGVTGIDCKFYGHPADGITSFNVATEINADEGVHRSQQYANRITMLGENDFGTRFMWRWTNQDAIAPTAAPGDEYVGHVISKVVKLDEMRTVADGWAKLLEQRAQLRRRHLNLRSLKATFSPALHPGEVVQVIGGINVGSDAKKFRVVAIAHDPASMASYIAGHEMVGV